MISSQHINANSSWNAVYPYSLSSAVTVNFEDVTENSSSSQDGDRAQISDVVLRPLDDEKPASPAVVSLRGENDINISGLHVLTNARHMEVYDDRGQYVETVRGGKDDHEGTPKTAYRKNVIFGTPLPSCSVKFLSLDDKGSLSVFSLGVTISRRKEDKGQQYPKKQIDMGKVRDMLSTMSSPVPENVEQLMQTVERYQQNQSSVWSEVQQEAVQSAARNPSAAAPMVGMLNMLARAGQRSDTVDDSNTVNDAMNKMMASMVGGRGNDRELYNSLQGICRNVSQMRVDERKQRQPKESFPDENSEKEASGVEKEAATTARMEHSRLTESLAHVLTSQLTAMEERMMGRLERRLDEMESRLELRLNRVEAIVEDVARHNRETGMGTVDTTASDASQLATDDIEDKGSTECGSMDEPCNPVGSDKSLKS